MTDMTRDKLVEVMARVRCAADTEHGDGAAPAIFDVTEHRGDCTNEPFSCALCHANEYREAVGRDFSALSAAGYALVPLEATEEMADAALNTPLTEQGTMATTCRQINAANAKGNILEEDG